MVLERRMAAGVGSARLSHSPPKAGISRQHRKRLGNRPRISPWDGDPRILGQAFANCCHEGNAERLGCEQGGG